jgi:5-methylthioadenosine/S-adenosylhomocysteine deaminase
MPVGRRDVLSGLAAAAALPSLVRPAAARTRPTGRKILIKGGYVATLDKNLGELSSADVLIDGTEIVAIGKNLSAADAEVIDATRTLVLPGLIDTHRHTWETVTRSLISEGDLAVYIKLMFGTLGLHYRPQDVYIGNLLGAVGALNSGITTMLDWSHIMNSPAHADAAIRGLADSGMRAVFAYGSSAVPGSDASDAVERRAADIKRVQKQYFASADQLLTLAIAARGSPASVEPTIADIRLAREIGVRITMHVTKAGVVAALNEAGMLGPDITYVHTVGIEATDDELRMIADHGGTISTSSATEMMSGHGFPSAQRWLRHGLRPSFSVDNETRMPSDLFAQMRALVIADHQLEADRARREGGRPTLIPVRDVLEFATIDGARAVGLDGKTGTLSVGKRADIILVDLDDISLIPATDPVATAVLRAQPANVSWMLVDGKVRKRAGKLVGLDLARIRRLVQDSHTYVLGLINSAGFDIHHG